MELCSFSGRTLPQHLPFLPPSLLSVSGSFVLSKTQFFSFSQKVSPHALLHLTCPPQQLPSRNSRKGFLASASSLALLDPKEDLLPDELEVSQTQQPDSAVKLSVHVPPTVCDDCYRRLTNELMKKAKIPGFRPGKRVPESALLSHVGKNYVQKASVESILKRTLPHAMSLVNNRALKDSVRIITEFDDMVETYTSSKSFRYDILVDVVPEIKWVPENGYKNLKVIVEIDSDIDAKRASKQDIKRRHKSLGSLKIVTSRGLQIGDVAVLDISATTIDQDGSNVKEIPSAEMKGFHFDTEEGDNLIHGFLDCIIGMQRGETKSFPLIFPESWSQEDLRGIHSLFTVECKELFYRDLPELDDSLSDKLLPGCSTLDQVEESLLQRYLEVEQTLREQATDKAVLDQLCKMIEVDIPRSLFEEQGRQLYGAKLLQIQAHTKLNEQQLASLSSRKAVNEYLENQKENIISIIKQNLATGDIFKREGLEVSTEEVVKEVESSIAEYKRHKQEFDEEHVKEQVQELIEGAKVLEWLREHAEIHYCTPSEKRIASH